MCHSSKPALFPSTEPVGRIEGEVSAWRYAGRGAAGAGPCLAVLPDIYGCNAFYRGFAAYLAQAGAAEVLLVDPWQPFGELREETREAAFERRHKLADRRFMEALSAFLVEQGVQGVVGFCIGGLFVFELARRGVGGALVAFYPFPQGLPNQDALAVPFDYLGAVQTPHTVLVGARDTLLGDENLRRLQGVAARNPALDLHVLPEAGHGFLSDLESDDALRAATARSALDVCVQKLFAGRSQ